MKNDSYKKDKDLLKTLAMARAEKNGRPNIILISAEEFKAYSIEESRQ
ncbi:MAG: hypothetical protein K6F82_00780 [Sphaerochaetaceae bacterium]|nr:hypothetical protein [Sphaerochaetaceae bacterium]